MVCEAENDGARVHLGSMAYSIPMIRDAQGKETERFVPKSKRWFGDQSAVPVPCSIVRIMLRRVTCDSH